MSCTVSALQPPVPDQSKRTHWGRLYADAAALAMAGLVTAQDGTGNKKPMIVSQPQAGTDAQRRQ